METAKKSRGREGEILNGKYRLDRYLATGGMGEVYQATNLALGRVVAVKLLLDEFASDDAIFQRFMLEARAANIVQHENIVQVFDVDKTEAGTPFIVQEFLRGETLAQRIRRTKEGIPAKQLLDILIPVVDAIGEAHKKGVVHRDIKPSNVFLAKRKDEVVGKVFDFGISRIGSDKDDVRLTKTTTILGSPAYMSPEQIQSSRDVTARSDVWSIGVMMYELLSGQLPFRGESSSDIIVKVCTKDPLALHVAVPGIGSGLAEVISRCLSRRADERYADGASLAMALREVREQEFSATIPPYGATPTFSADKNTARRELNTDLSDFSVSTATSLKTMATHSTGSYSTHHTTTARTHPSRTSVNSETYRHSSYDDIPSILGGFLVLAGLVILSFVVAPSPGDGFRETGDYSPLIVQLLLAGGVFYLSGLVRDHASQFAGRGTTLALVGLYGVCGSLALLTGAMFIGEKATLGFLYSAILLSVAVTTFGFVFVGFEYIKHQIAEENGIAAPGVLVGVFMLAAATVGLRFLGQVVG